MFASDDLMQPDRLEILRERAKSDRAAIVADNLLAFSADQPKGKYFLSQDYTKVPRWIGLAEYIDSNRLYSRTRGAQRSAAAGPVVARHAFL